MERESGNVGNVGRETPANDPTTLTETPVLSPPLMDPRGGLGRGVLKYSPAQRAGTGPGLPGGRGLPGGAGPQLHLQERTIMLDSCSTLGLRPT